jgi:epoxyqueuosine reductase
MREKIETLLLGETPDLLVGFAKIDASFGAEFAGFGYAVSIAARLDPATIDEIDDRPTQRYLALYHDTNQKLTRIVLRLSAMLDKNGVKNLPIKPTMEDAKLDSDYYRTLRTAFSHKMAATKAGLGWIGKTDLLVTEAYGPRVRLATVLLQNGLTDGDVGSPILMSRCGSCNLCVQKCPAQAANGKLWDTTVDRDQFYDAFKCREMCRYLTKTSLDVELSICGICVAVCPRGRNSKNTGSPHQN